MGLAPFSPPCEGGVRGGGPGTTSHKVFPCSLPLSRFAFLSRGGKNRFRFPRLPPHPPCPPFARGGKGSLARDVIPSRAIKTRVSKPSLQCGQDQLCSMPGSDLAERVALAGVLLPRKACGDHAALVSELVGLARVEPTPREDLAAQCPDSRRAVCVLAMILASLCEGGGEWLARVIVFVDPLDESVRGQILLQRHAQGDRCVVEGRERRHRGNEAGSQGRYEVRGVERSRQHGA